MAIILKTTEDKTKLVNAYSSATSMKEYVESHPDQDIMISDLFVFDKGEVELTVMILETGEILGTNSQNIKNAVKFLYDMGIDNLPVKARLVLNRSKNNREYLDIIF